MVHLSIDSQTHLLQAVVVIRCRMQSAEYAVTGVAIYQNRGIWNIAMICCYSYIACLLL